MRDNPEDLPVETRQPRLSRGNALWSLVEDLDGDPLWVLPAEVFWKVYSVADVAAGATLAEFSAWSLGVEFAEEAAMAAMRRAYAACNEC